MLKTRITKQKQRPQDKPQFYIINNKNNMPDNKTKNETLKDLFEQSKKENINDTFPSMSKAKVSDEMIVKLTESIATNLGITKHRALIGIVLLFLKGAANASAPDSLSIPIGNEGTILTKGKLKDHCKAACDHTYLRRIAESMALYIGNFADDNDMTGDLYKSINNKCLSQHKRPLTRREAAFASSFTRDGLNNINEIAESEVLAQLLAEDYQERSAILQKKAMSAKQSANQKGGRKK